MTPQTATSPDYTAPSASVTFATGAEVEEVTIPLIADVNVEDIEYFQVTIGISDSTTAVTGTVDTNLMMADVFIIDESCKCRIRKFIET